MQNQELIEEQILSTKSIEELYSISYVNNEEESTKTTQQGIMQIMKTSGLICDNLRSANLANYENFKKRLSNDFLFSNEEVIKKLYNYGMFVSR